MTRETKDPFEDSVIVRACGLAIQEVFMDGFQAEGEYHLLTVDNRGGVIARPLPEGILAELFSQESPEEEHFDGDSERLSQDLERHMSDLAYERQEYDGPHHDPWHDDGEPGGPTFAITGQTSFEADWGPLERAFPVGKRAHWMYMGGYPIACGTTVHAYKHRLIRHYINLSDDGRAWAHVGEDGYMEVPRDAAIHDALAPCAESAA
jgi:hypothetical protein